MSNGLGAGFAALSLLAVLGGLAAVSVLAAGGAALFGRRTGRLPAPLRYLSVAVGGAVVAVAGFAAVGLADEAPAAAGLFAMIGLVPPLFCGGYLRRTTDGERSDVVVTTALAWGLPFLLGVVVVFGVNAALTATFELPTGGARQRGVPWLASAAGGLAVTVGTVLLAERLFGVVQADPRSGP